MFRRVGEKNFRVATGDIQKPNETNEIGSGFVQQRLMHCPPERSG